ncbi:MAG: helicase-exonuclease AddAB subunit AddA [Clostridia bacterium]|nr:helicase-exonuclease AddAB subunit AddA [Clostridia bacterium]
MAGPQWTAQQQHCIHARGGTVLVSAAAGSGKTAVLIERIVSLLTDPDHPVDVDQLLVVTFTKAAAAEMRARLGKRLAEESAADPLNRRLLRQQMLLPQASICTIDSFCAQLLREQAQAIGISPRFRVAEETHLKLLKQDIARQVVDEAHARGDAAFKQLCDTLAGDRGDQRVIDQLLRTYEFIQAHPFPLSWLERQEAQYRKNGPIASTVWGQILLSQAKRELTAAAESLTIAVDAMADDEKMQAAYGPSVSASLSQTLSALEQIDRQNWDDAANAVHAISFDRVKALRGYEDEAFKQYIGALRSHAKDAVEKAADRLQLSEEEAALDLEHSRPLISALFDLVRTFTDRLRDAKAEQNMLDFNDMEHLALSFLAIPNEDGTFTRTEAAKEIGARYTHIMVDEYQDTNATQDTLFSALSDDEKNLFFVGDIKQSIYGFRQAMPTIFRNRRENSTPYDGEHFPAAITLGNNFRSRKQVTAAVNDVFRKLMSEETGGIVYDEREALVASASFEAVDSPDYDTELIVSQKSECTESLSAHQIEARLIGQRILAMLREGFCVSGKGGLRKATLRDMCILLRSTGRTAPIYVKELQAMGIPVSTGSHESFFDCAEIRSVLCLLRTIDNPLLDIPMIGTLMSPLFGFTPDDLARVRQHDRDLPLYTVLRRVSCEDGELAARCRKCLASLEEWRVLSAALPSDQLIRRLYEQTDLLSVMSAKSGGTARIANLRKLYDVARHYEDNDFRGLSSFVRYLDKLEAQGIAIPTASKDNDSQNAVKLMTIHRSKGLEFPVVFLAGLGTDFNNASIREDVLLHADYGVALPLRDRELLTEHDPFSRKALAAAITHSERTEELRVLYVAMTRAKDKLILMTTMDKLSSTLERLHIAAGERDVLPPSFVLGASRMSDWILAAALHHPAGKPLREVLQGQTPFEHRSDGLFIRFMTPHADEAERLSDSEDADAITLSLTPEALAYRYPYAALSGVASKITASGLAHDTASDDRVYLRRPSFLSKSGLSPAERGTATHLFLEHADFASGDAEAQADALVARGLLTQKQRDALDLAKLDRFLHSELMARMQRSPRIYREWSFSIERPVSDFVDCSSLPPDAAKEAVLVQGVVDAAFEEDGHLVIVDYKTDRVARVEELAERYHEQLAVYKDALERALQCPVAHCIIYSFHLEKAIEL